MPCATPVRRTSEDTLEEGRLNKFGIGQPVPRVEDPRFITGRGRYVDDIELPHQALRRRGDVAARPCAHQKHRYREGQSRRRRARGADRRRREGRQARRAGAADAGRHGRAEGLSYAARDPRSRQGARGRRPCRFRRRRDAGAGAKRRRTDRDRLRAAAGGHRRRGCGETRRAGGMGRGAQQRRLHADDGQQGCDRRRLRQRQACRHR